MYIETAIVACSFLATVVYVYQKELDHSARTVWGRLYTAVDMATLMLPWCIQGIYLRVDKVARQAWKQLEVKALQKKLEELKRSNQTLKARVAYLERENQLQQNLLDRQTGDLAQYRVLIVKQCAAQLKMAQEKAALYQELLGLREKEAQAAHRFENADAMQAYALEWQRLIDLYEAEKKEALSGPSPFTDNIKSLLPQWKDELMAHSLKITQLLQEAPMQSIGRDLLFRMGELSKRQLGQFEMMTRLSALNEHRLQLSQDPVSPGALNEKVAVLSALLLSA